MLVPLEPYVFYRGVTVNMEKRASLPGENSAREEISGLQGVSFFRNELAQNNFWKFASTLKL